MLDGVGGAAGRAAFERLDRGGRHVIYGWSAGELTQITGGDIVARSLTVSSALVRRATCVRSRSARSLQGHAGDHDLPARRGGHRPRGAGGAQTVGKVVRVLICRNPGTGARHAHPLPARRRDPRRRACPRRHRRQKKRFRGETAQSRQRHCRRQRVRPRPAHGHLVARQRLPTARHLRPQRHDPPAAAAAGERGCVHGRRLLPRARRGRHPHPGPGVRPGERARSIRPTR